MVLTGCLHMCCCPLQQTQAELEATAAKLKSALDANAEQLNSLRQELQASAALAASLQEQVDFNQAALQVRISGNEDMPLLALLFLFSPSFNVLKVLFFTNLALQNAEEELVSARSEAAKAQAQAEGLEAESAAALDRTVSAEMQVKQLSAELQEAQSMLTSATFNLQVGGWPWQAFLRNRFFVLF